jgi:hypothetical protein
MREPFFCLANAMNPSRLTSSFAPCLPGLAAVLMLLCSAPLWAQSQSGSPTVQRQQAEAMSRLSATRRQQYFADRRQLEKRISSQRLSQLSKAEDCFVKARDLAAIESCQRSQQDQAMEQRRRWMTERAELQRRFGMPSWGKDQRQQKKGA